MQRINGFIREQPWFRLAVCCRHAEYQAIRKKLRLNGAIHLRPLSEEQIAEYLNASGTQGDHLRQAIAKDSRILHWVSNPLQLHALLTALSHDDRVASMAMSPENSDPLRFIRCFVDQMLAREIPAIRGFAPAAMHHFLEGLADRIHNSASQVQFANFFGEPTPFQIPAEFTAADWCQPEVIDSADEVRRYGLGIWILTAGLVAIPMAGWTLLTGSSLCFLFAPLLLAALYATLPVTEIALEELESRKHLAQEETPTGRWLAEPVVLVLQIANAMLEWAWIGAVVAIVDESPAEWLRAAGYATVLGLLLKPVCFLAKLVLSPLWALAVRPAFLVRGFSAGPDVGRGVDKGLRLAAFIGVIVGVERALGSGLLDTLLPTALVTLVCGIVLGTVNLLRYPAFRHSVETSLTKAVVVGSTGSLIGWYVWGTNDAIVLSFVWCAVWSSGIVPKFMLRLHLWLVGEAPWNIEAFFHYCTRISLLQRTERGYSFAHKMYLQYFAREFRASQDREDREERTPN